MDNYLNRWKGNVKGLCGNYDLVAANDLKSSSGNAILIDSKPKKGKKIIKSKV